MSGAIEDPKHGDRSFTGMDAQTAAEKLPPGMVQRAFDCRFRTGEVAPRPGYRDTGWFNPEHYPYYGEGTTGFFVSLADVVYVSGGAAPIESATLTAYAVEGVPGAGPFTAGNVGKYLRFDTGRILEVTAYTDEFTVTVSDEAYYAYDASGAFTIVSKNIATAQSVANGAVTRNAGMGVYSDPNGLEYGMIAQSTRVYFGGPYMRPFTVPYEDGEAVDISAGDEAFFLQCFDQVLLFRGEENAKSPLVWDGDLNGKFKSITATSLASFDQVLPPASRGIFFGNRVWVGFDRDRIAVSDIGVYTRYYYLDNEFRLNEGNANKFMNFFPYGKRSLLVFFSREIWLLENVVGGSDLLDNLTARRISNRIGLGSRDGVCAVGDDVWFVDQNGDTWGISQVDETRMQLTGQPVSWPIKPLMDDLGAQRVHTWTCAYDNGYFYLSFAIFAFNTVVWNARVAVYDTIRGAWAGVDTASIDSYHYLNYQGRTRLFAGNYTGGTFSLVGEGSTDYRVSALATQDYRINTEVWTRAVQQAELEMSQTARILVRLGTLNPTFSITLKYVGESGSTALATNKTFDRTAYATWGQTAFTVTNANSDYTNPHREDYLVLGDDDILLNESGSSLDPGLQLNPRKDWRLLYPVSWQGQSAYLIITNTDATETDPDESAVVLKAWGLELQPAGAQIVSLN